MIVGPFEFLIDPERWIGDSLNTNVWNFYSLIHLSACTDWIPCMMSTCSVVSPIRWPTTSQERFRSVCPGINWLVVMLICYSPEVSGWNLETTGIFTVTGRHVIDTFGSIEKEDTWGTTWNGGTCLHVSTKPWNRNIWRTLAVDNNDGLCKVCARRISLRRWEFYLINLSMYTVLSVHMVKLSHPLVRVCNW